jgi:hypothetical protein
VVLEDRLIGATVFSLVEILEEKDLFFPIVFLDCEKYSYYFVYQHGGRFVNTLGEFFFD